VNSEEEFLEYMRRIAESLEELLEIVRAHDVFESANDE